MEERLEKLSTSSGGTMVSVFFDNLYSLLSLGPVSENDARLPALLSKASPFLHRLAHHNGLHKLILSCHTIDYSNGHYYLKKHLKKSNAICSKGVLKPALEEHCNTDKVMLAVAASGSPLTSEVNFSLGTPMAGDGEVMTCCEQIFAEKTPVSFGQSEKMCISSGNIFFAGGTCAPTTEKTSTTKQTLLANDILLPSAKKSPSHCLKSFNNDISPIAWDLMPNEPKLYKSPAYEMTTEEAIVPTSNTSSLECPLSRCAKTAFTDPDSVAQMVPVSSFIEPLAVSDSTLQAKPVSSSVELRAVGDCDSTAQTAPVSSPFDGNLPSDDDSADLESNSTSSLETSYDSATASSSKFSTSPALSQTEDYMDCERQSRSCSASLSMLSPHLPSQISPIANEANSPTSFDPFRGVSAIFSHEDSKRSSIQESIPRLSDLNQSPEVLRDLSAQGNFTQASVNSSSKSRTSNDEDEDSTENAVQTWKEKLQKLARETRLIRTSLVVGKPQAVSTPAVPTNSPASAGASPLEKCIFQFPSATTLRDSDNPEDCSLFSEPAGHDDGLYFASARAFFPSEQSPAEPSVDVNISNTVAVSSTSRISQLPDKVIVGSLKSSAVKASLENGSSSSPSNLKKVTHASDISPHHAKQSENKLDRNSVIKSNSACGLQEQVFQQQIVASNSEDGGQVQDQPAPASAKETLHQTASPGFPDLGLQATTAVSDSQDQHDTALRKKSLDKQTIRASSDKDDQHDKTQVNIDPDHRKECLINDSNQLTMDTMPHISSSTSDQPHENYEIAGEYDSLASKIIPQQEPYVQPCSPENKTSVMKTEKVSNNTNNFSYTQGTWCSVSTEISFEPLLFSVRNGSQMDSSGQSRCEVGEQLEQNAGALDCREEQDPKECSKVLTLSSFADDSLEIEPIIDHATSPRKNVPTLHSHSFIDASLEVHLSTTEDACLTPDLLGGFHYVNNNQHEGSPELGSLCEDMVIDYTIEPRPCKSEHLSNNACSVNCPTSSTTVQNEFSDFKEDVYSHAQRATSCSTATGSSSFTCDDGSYFRKRSNVGFLRRSSSVQDLLSLNLTYSSRSDCSPMVSPWSKATVDKSDATEEASSTTYTSRLEKFCTKSISSDGSKHYLSAATVIIDNVDTMLKNKKENSISEGTPCTPGDSSIIQLPNEQLESASKTTLSLTGVSVDCVTNDASQIDRRFFQRDSLLTSSPMSSASSSAFQLSSLVVGSKMSTLLTVDSKKTTSRNGASTLTSQVSPQILISPCDSSALAGLLTASHGMSTGASERSIPPSPSPLEDSPSMVESSTASLGLSCYGLEDSPAMVDSSTASSASTRNSVSPPIESSSSAPLTLFLEGSSTMVASSNDSPRRHSEMSSALEPASRAEENVDVCVNVSVVAHEGSGCSNSSVTSLTDPAAGGITVKLDMAGGSARLDPELLHRVSLPQSLHLGRDAEDSDQETHTDYEYLYKEMLQKFQEYQVRSNQEILQLTQSKQDTTLDLEEILREKDALEKTIAQLRAENALLKAPPKPALDTSSPVKETSSVADTSDVVERLKNNHDRLAVKYATLYADYQALNRRYLLQSRENSVASKWKVNEKEVNIVLATSIAPNRALPNSGLVAHLRCVYQSYNACRQHLNELKDQVCLILRFIGPSSKDFDMALLDHKFLELWETKSLHLLIRSHPSHLNVTARGSRYPAHFETDLHEKYMIFLLGCWKSCVAYTTNQYVARYRPRPSIQRSLTMVESHAEAHVVEEPKKVAACQAALGDDAMNNGAGLKGKDDEASLSGASKTSVPAITAADSVVVEKVDVGSYVDPCVNSPVKSGKDSCKNIEEVAACDASHSIDSVQCDNSKEATSLEATSISPLELVPEDNKGEDVGGTAITPAPRELYLEAEQMTGGFSADAHLEDDTSVCHSPDEKHPTEKEDVERTSGQLNNERLQMEPSSEQGVELIKNIVISTTEPPLATVEAKSWPEIQPPELTEESTNDLSEMNRVDCKCESEVPCSGRLNDTLSERTLLNCMPTVAAAQPSQYRKALHSKLRRSSLPTVQASTLGFEPSFLADRASDFKSSCVSSPSPEEEKRIFGAAWQEIAKPSQVLEAQEPSKTPPLPEPTSVAPDNAKHPISLYNLSEDKEVKETRMPSGCAVDDIIGGLMQSRSVMSLRDTSAPDDNGRMIQSSERQVSGSLSIVCGEASLNPSAALFNPPDSGVYSDLFQGESVGNASVHSSRRIRGAAAAPIKTGDSIMKHSSHYHSVAAPLTAVVRHPTVQESQQYATEYNSFSRATVSTAGFPSDMEHVHSIRPPPHGASEATPSTVTLAGQQACAVPHTPPVSALHPTAEAFSRAVSPAKGLVTYNTPLPRGYGANDPYQGIGEYSSYDPVVSQLNCTSPSGLFSNGQIVHRQHNRTIAEAMLDSARSPLHYAPFSRFSSTLPSDVSSTYSSRAYAPAIADERPLLNSTASDMILPLNNQPFKSFLNKPVDYDAFFSRPSSQEIALNDSVLFKAAIQQILARNVAQLERFFPDAQDVQAKHVAAATPAPHEWLGKVSRANVPLASGSVSAPISPSFIANTNHRNLADYLSDSLVPNVMMTGERKLSTTPVAYAEQEQPCNPWIKLQKERLLAKESSTLDVQTSVYDCNERGSVATGELSSTLALPPNAHVQRGSSSPSSPTHGSVMTSQGSTSSQAVLLSEGIASQGNLTKPERVESSSSGPARLGDARPTSTCRPGAPYIPQYTEGLRGVGRGMAGRVKSSSSVGQKNDSSNVTVTTAASPTEPLLSILPDVPSTKECSVQYNDTAKTVQTVDDPSSGATGTPVTLRSVKLRVPTPYPKKMSSMQLDLHARHQDVGREDCFSPQLHVEVDHPSINLMADKSTGKSKKRSEHQNVYPTSSSTNLKVSSGSMYDLDPITSLATPPHQQTRSVEEYSSRKCSKQLGLRSPKRVGLEAKSSPKPDGSSACGSTNSGDVATKQLHSVRPKQRTLAPGQAGASPQVPGGGEQRGGAQSTKTVELVELKNYLLRYFQHISRKQLEVYLQEVREKCPGRTLVGKRFHEVAAMLRVQICLFEGAEESRCCMVCGRPYGKRGTSMLKCLHCFHSKCIKKWGQLKKQCPLCLSDLEYDDEGRQNEATFLAA